MFTKTKFLSAIFLASSLSLCAESELDRIIPGEIKNDAFYRSIYRLASSETVNTILEIGSSSGEGSTEAFVLGIRVNPNHPTLFCMELSRPRFAALARHYENDPQVKCYNVSSVPLEVFPSESEVASFYNNVSSTLRLYTLDRVLGWLRQDIDYVKTAGVAQTGIELIKTENHITDFDMVLIDGSEFTGMAEFQFVYGAKFILLDDINAFKNYANYKQLLSDPGYELIEQNHQLRNGYAVFKRKS
ncbi:MAG TPA: hypothetical protein VLG49_00370 [Rhabdochlamydiaceae bacterium]|nr:hypothetical protein [Rhabdochlamydiaceae bacterium]